MEEGFQMSDKEIIKTDKAPAPGGWYSQAVKSLPFVFVSGCVAADPKTGKLVAPGNMAAQTEQVMKNLEAILEASGATMADVVKTTVFVDDIGKFGEFNEVYRRFFPNDPPARSTVQVGKFMPGMCIEVEAIARVER